MPPRERLSRGIVKWVSGWIGTAYRANCYELPRVEDACFAVSKFFQPRLFPIANYIDKEAMLDQMANEGWWG